MQGGIFHGQVEIVMCRNATFFFQNKTEHAIFFDKDNAMCSFNIPDRTVSIKHSANDGHPLETKLFQITKENFVKLVEILTPWSNVILPKHNLPKVEP